MTLFRIDEKNTRLLTHREQAGENLRSFFSWEESS